MNSKLFDSLGIVVIGRNLAWRLAETLESCPNLPHRVYVDSGSSDGSLALARSLGWETIEMEPPFTAAKSRNAGVEYLLSKAPHLSYIQLLDGDCRLCDGWLKLALHHLSASSTIGGVSGYLVEEEPQRNPYHLITNWEWAHSTGHFGGTVMLSARAFQSVGGFDPSLIAGEDMDLCHRLRTAGWEDVKLTTVMAIHDVRIKSFRQWWRRTVRGGYAYALLLKRHRTAWRESLSIWLWALILPGLALFNWGWTGCLALLAFQLLRIFWRQCLSGLSAADAFTVAILCLGGKWPMLAGQLRFILAELSGRTPRLIEYQE